MKIGEIFSKLWKVSKFSFIVIMEFEHCDTAIAVRCQTSMSHGVLVVWRWQYFLYFSFVSCNEILQMLDFIYLFILFFLLFLIIYLLIYLFIYLFKTVTVKCKNSNTRITVDFGRLILPKKTSWTSLMATKFQKKLPRKLSVTSNNNFFFFLSGDWVRRMWGTRMPRYSSGWRQWSG